MEDKRDALTMLQSSIHAHLSCECHRTVWPIPHLSVYRSRASPAVLSEPSVPFVPLGGLLGGPCGAGDFLGDRVRSGERGKVHGLLGEAASKGHLRTEGGIVHQGCLELSDRDLCGAVPLADEVLEVGQMTDGTHVLSH